MKLKVKIYIRQSNVSMDVYGTTYDGGTDEYQVLLGTQDVELEVHEISDSERKNKVVCALREQRSAVLAGATVECHKIDEKIQQLLALDAPKAGS